MKISNKCCVLFAVMAAYGSLNAVAAQEPDLYDRRQEDIKSLQYELVGLVLSADLCLRSPEDKIRRPENYAAQNFARLTWPLIGNLSNHELLNKWSRATREIGGNARIIADDIAEEIRLNPKGMVAEKAAEMFRIRVEEGYIKPSSSRFSSKDIERAITCVFGNHDSIRNGPQAKFTPIKTSAAQMLMELERMRGKPIENWSLRLENIMNSLQTCEVIPLPGATRTGSDSQNLRQEHIQSPQDRCRCRLVGLLLSSDWCLKGAECQTRDPENYAMQHFVILTWPLIDSLSEAELSKKEERAKSGIDVNAYVMEDDIAEEIRQNPLGKVAASAAKMLYTCKAEGRYVAYDQLPPPRTAQFIMSAFENQDFIRSGQEEKLTPIEADAVRMLAELKRMRGKLIENWSPQLQLENIWNTLQEYVVL
jgi:hypothetical protein